MMFYLYRMCQCGLHAVLRSHMSLYLCASSVHKYISFPLSVSVERSFRSCIRWGGTGGYQEQRQCIFIGQQSIVGCFTEFVFQFSVTQVHVGLRKQFRNNFIYPTLACAGGFNNNNKLLAPFLSSTFFHFFL